MNIQTLAEEFPKQFKDGDTPCYSEYPDGWHHLIRNVMKRVDSARLPIKWAQIKEKFGSLRMYEDVYEGHSALVELYDWIGEAERLSMITCQCCGAKGKRQNLTTPIGTSWVGVFCDPCKRKREAN